MTLLELPTAAAGAGIVALDAGKGALQNLHNLLCFAITPEQAGHDLHGKIHMVEERLEPGAQVVQARFAIRRLDKSILRALAVTGKTHIALQTITRQRVPLVLAEFYLLGRRHQLDHVLFLDVAQEVVRLDKVVARVEITVVLDGQPRAAGLVEDAHPRSAHAQPVAQRCLEGLHVDAAHVVAHPLVEDGAEETAELLRQHRPLRDCTPFLIERQAVRVDALHDRDELHPVGPGLVAQEAIDLQRIVAVHPIDGREDIVLDAMLLKQA